jgi:hypothetical protein
LFPPIAPILLALDAVVAVPAATAVATVDIVVAGAATVDAVTLIEAATADWLGEGGAAGVGSPPSSSIVDADPAGTTTDTPARLANVVSPSSTITVELMPGVYPNTNCVPRMPTIEIGVVTVTFAFCILPQTKRKTPFARLTDIFPAPVLGLYTNSSNVTSEFASITIVVPSLKKSRLVLNEPVMIFASNATLSPATTDWRFSPTNA